MFETSNSTNSNALGHRPPEEVNSVPSHPCLHPTSTHTTTQKISLVNQLHTLPKHEHHQLASSSQVNNLSASQAKFHQARISWASSQHPRLEHVVCNLFSKRPTSVRYLIGCRLRYSNRRLVAMMFQTRRKENHFGQGRMWIGDRDV